jgi:hypothetical protein
VKLHASVVQKNEIKVKEETKRNQLKKTDIIIESA